MIKAILDTNVILDFIKVRDFHEDAARILDFACTRRFKAYFSAHQVTTLAYYLEKAERSPGEFRRKLSGLLEYIEPLPVNGETFQSALRSTIRDFEDAVLESVAFKHGIQHIVTRNIRDFSTARVQALTPSEFLRLFSASNPVSDTIRDPTPTYHSAPRRRRKATAKTGGNTKAKPGARPKAK
jgi:predicted nucleic acid-binding protein